MRLVVEWTYGDGCTYWGTATVPVNYESAEDFIVDFKKFCHDVMEREFTRWTPVFAGREWEVSEFFENGVYYDPTIMTVDEWFGREQ